MKKIKRLLDIKYKENNNYTKKNKTIQYIPKEQLQPLIESLYDDRKYEYLKEKIKKLNIDENIKNFLILSATRFLIFNFEKIAEYYCHANKEIQEIMEDLALVIIDFEDAMEKGYIELSKDMVDIYEQNQ